MVHKKSPKYGVCCYFHVKAAYVLKIVHVFSYWHTNTRMIPKRMVLHVNVFNKTFKILMMASMMANSDALSTIQSFRQESRRNNCHLRKFRDTDIIVPRYKEKEGYHVRT